MMLKGNLATRPFYNERFVNGLLVLAAVAGLAMAAYNTARLLDLGGERATRVATRNTAKADAALIRARAEREQKSVDRLLYLQLSAATFEANGLIDDRTFSWTVFFGQLEKTLPYDVRLIQVAPRWEREVFGINMIVNVKRREDLSAFLDALQSTQSFYDVFASEQQVMEDGTYNATVEGGYIAPGKPAKASGAPGGSQRP
jgi:hypothetical protein